MYPAAELWSKKSLFFYKDLEIFQKNVYPFTIIFALSLSLSFYPTALVYPIYIHSMCDIVNLPMGQRREPVLSILAALA